jgi:adenylate cyclase
MGTEIERRFLVISDAWKENAEGVTYRQGFLTRDKERTVRVRVAGDKGFITIKGKTRKDGSKPEYEYEIPAAEAEELLEMCLPGRIKKQRHKIPHKGHLWEVDVFKGDNKGLTIAEIELSSPEETFAIPDWVGEEVTGDSRFSNASLSKKPWNAWKKADRKPKR